MNMQDILENPQFLETCQIEALGQLADKGVSQAEIKENPEMFAHKVFEVAQMFLEVKQELDAA